jgi:hypothetical protein
MRKFWVSVGTRMCCTNGDDMASKRRLRRKSCDKKTVYATREDALMACSTYLKKFKSRIVPYKCQFANHWHNGHMPKRKEEILRSINLIL